jgi:hypothetical protein
MGINFSKGTSWFDMLKINIWVFFRRNKVWNKKENWLKEDKMTKDRLIKLTRIK